MCDLTIRLETPEDYRAVEELTRKVPRGAAGGGAGSRRAGRKAVDV